MSKPYLPITLVTGYLGSGKTTLLNHILKDAKNHKIAVIVNDIGEVNIDAELIEKGGIVSSDDNDLVPLSNGCICCTLKADLIKQITNLATSGKYDHILIEASGICEPVPIAQSISYMVQQYEAQGVKSPYYLDAIISVTDAKRLSDEFGCGESLETAERGEEDLENLIIQQIEFCDIILLNKASDVTGEELKRIKMTIRALQPEAKIIDTDYCNIDVNQLIDLHLFDFDKAAGSAAWIKEFEDWDNDVEHHEDDDDHDDDDEHEEHHHHHHHHEGIENEEEGTALEYGINTFVYYRRRPIDRDLFTYWVQNNEHKIIRAKGIIYFSNETERSYIYESAGRQASLQDNGKWYSEQLSKRQIENLLKNDMGYAHDWDETYKDKLIKLVFIGQNLDEDAIRKELDQM